jgi:hypothetical protein
LLGGGFKYLARRQAADKLPAAPIFTEDGAQPWRRGNWAYELREAAKKVNGKTRRKDRIPAGVGAYFFGHARISELPQVHGVDPLTVAAQTGTSLAMIKKRTCGLFLLDRLATLSIKLTWSSRFFGKPIRGIPAPNASVAVRAKIFSEIDRRQGGDVTLRSI